jgi:DNA topoisomerase IA
MFEGMDVSFCYTQGKIFELPEDELGIGNDYQMDLRPVNDHRFEFLKSRISESKGILCLTDNDAEGEWIASHLKSLCEEFGVDFERLRLNALTREALEESLLSENKVIKEELVSLAKSRRVIDRVIGFHENSDKSLKRGRVLTPLINSIHKEPISSSATLVCNEKNTEVVLEGKKEAILELHQDIVEGKVKTLLGNAEIYENVELYNTIDILSDASMLDNKSPHEVFDEMQNMYEKGQVSYIRTVNKKYEVLNGEHRGIHYLGDLESDDTKGEANTALSLIKLRSVMHLQPDKFEFRSFSPSDEILNRLDKGNIRVKRISKVERKTKSAHELKRGISLLFGNMPRPQKGIRCRVIEHSPALDLLKRMETMGVGTPATYHLHARKVERLLVKKDNSLVLNQKGLRVALQSDAISLQLSKLENSKTIEALLFNNRLSIEEKCRKCLNVLRISESNGKDFTFSN